METKATSKGQITIPSKVRKELGIKDGTILRVDVNEATRQIILTPVTREFVRSLRGKYKGMGLMKALMEEKKQTNQIQEKLFQFSQ
jgi:AbrB family looped-hinge helix DNA binding protein